MEMKGTINGWRYYRNAQGEMVAYYMDIEQLIFKTDSDFYKWLDAEKKEQVERFEDLSLLNWEDESELRGAIAHYEGKLQDVQKTIEALRFKLNKLEEAR